MHKILLVAANKYFDSISTSNIIYSGQVNNPRYIKGLFTTFFSLSGYRAVLRSDEKPLRISSSEKVKC